MIDVAILFAVCTGLALALAPSLIRTLQALSFRQFAYEDAPKTHAVKTGTPTMGGVLFVMALLVVCAWHRDLTTWSLALLGIVCSAIGLVDDLAKVRGARNRGLSGAMKFVLTAIAALGFTLLVGLSGVANVGTILRAGAWQWNVVPIVWYLLGICVVLATTHAVNLTDGLDGLAGGTVVPPLLLFAWIAWRLGILGVVYVDVATIGAVLGFLAYNRHPARLFMGDTGALLLGGVLGGSAILTGMHLLLPLVGGVFAAETLSVIIQVAYYKKTRKRIFRMSPLHHHFELGGWPESTVTQRFWAASALCSLAGAAIAR
ncbi:MAG TPA: phospho-N-acetylmuramoyl-pentapeptide-transferase [Candidatus Acidoferrales bacterium]|nr:phospho-N-acetylmuramoyl-pentapeptide-transferase [Candidatus Acidoferrales bacterium]